MVFLIGQAQGGEHRTHFLPIHWLGNGKFWNLGDAEEMPADSFSGRFAGLLPPKPVDKKTRQMGKVLLEAMGVKVMQLGSTKSSLWSSHRLLLGGRKFGRLCSPKISSVFRHGRCFFRDRHARPAVVQTLGTQASAELAR